MPRHGNALVVMAKAPVSGEVKTRLVPPLSFDEAAELYRCLLLDLLENVRKFSKADLYVAFAPSARAPLFERLVPPVFTCFPQRGEDLGERMSNVFEELFRIGYKNIVIIGSDLPTFPTRFLEEAFGALTESKGGPVFGPSRDGGYYLVGLSRAIPEIFVSITWETDRVLEATRDRLSRLGVDASLLPEWFDVDTAEDLRLLGSRTAIAAAAQQRTLELLKKLELRQILPRGTG